VILVIEYGKTQKDQIEKALQLLEGKNLVGTILNKAVIPKKQAYAYGYSF
jgi:Mrp family chromosome partitioning ATPase